MMSTSHIINTLTYTKRAYRRTNLHLRDIINTTGAEVEFPSEADVAHELSLKRLFSVGHDYEYRERPQYETI